MLVRITLENFFSFSKAESVELNPGANILVGINGSGKSNFLKAIQLLYESIAGDGLEKLFLREWGGFESVAFNRENETFIKLIFEFDKNLIINDKISFSENPIYELSIVRAGKTAYYLEERVIILDPLKDKGINLLNISNGVGVVAVSANEGSLDYEAKIRDTPWRLKTSEPALRQLVDPEKYEILFCIKKAIESITTYDNFDTSFNSKIRQAASFDTDIKLRKEGDNLTPILMRMKTNQSLDYEKIETVLKKVNPHFKDISIDLLGARQLLYLREKLLSKAISIEHISDGTLRFLLLNVIFYNQNRGKIVCLDEPEAGLHPDMINTVAEAIKYATKDGTQLIIATHSALLLNAFDLDDILIFEKDERNQTKVTTKSDEDFEDWAGDYSVGQLWLQGLIGGKRW